jgi:GNAT superfamily N-acetyltransferase
MAPLQGPAPSLRGVGGSGVLPLTTHSTVRIRPRRRDDIPALADVLMSQQALTRYPFRDPLPVPVEEFLHAGDALAAWTAEVGGRPAGHVCRVRSPRGPQAAAMNWACARAHGCAVDELSWVSTLFVDPAARGLGIGRALMDTVVADMRTAGVRPCLEVLPVHSVALALYESAGWQEVLRLRPDWLTTASGDVPPDVRVLVVPA